jgi:uncharacterized membrane protein
MEKAIPHHLGEVNSKMWKKALIALSLLAFTAAATVPAEMADARPRSFSSGKSSFTQIPKAKQSVSKTRAGASSNSAIGGTAADRGFFSGGSFLRGMMIGGLAGMLFGGLFGGMGFFGDLLGLLVNLAALLLLFAVIRAAVDAYRRRRNSHSHEPPRRW